MTNWTKDEWGVPRDIFGRTPEQARRRRVELGLEYEMQYIQDLIVSETGKKQDQKEENNVQ